MKKRKLIMYILLPFVVFGTTAAACKDAGIPTPGHGEGRDGWWEVKDPETDRTFRCVWWSLKDSTAMWCYEPQPTDI